MFIKELLYLYLLYAYAHTCEAYKVLLVFPIPGKSHCILGDGIAKHLLEAGHEVTYITAFPKTQNLHPLLREIDFSSLQSIFPESTGSIEILMKNKASIQLPALVSIFYEVSQKFLEHETTKAFLSDPKEQFDVIIAEWMFLDLYSGLAAVFKCPFIWFSTVDPHWMVLKLIDEIPNPTYNADTLSSNVPPFSFLQRLEELWSLGSGLIYQYFTVSNIERREYERLLVPHIRNRGHKVPDFEELRYNASLMLGNSHVALGQSIHLPQSYKAVGGYHIDDKIKPLPEDLKMMLDNAKAGLIYFSMGSNLRSKFMPEQVKADLLKMFGKLKQTVLWKFEEDLPNRPNNVHIIQWAPQQSILAHPNCILFITHGGLLSTTEAIHFAKPMIGIPVFGDQFNNVDRFVKRGVAKRVDLSYTMADNLEVAIKDILENPSYSSKVKELSFVYHDRTIPPREELVHWVEHVVRTGGALHLRSPALMVPWYQKYYLDVVALVIASLYTVILVIKTLLISKFLKSQQKKKIQ